jgi:hypothetical protein
VVKSYIGENPRFAPSLMHAGNVTADNDTMLFDDCQVGN